VTTIPEPSIPGNDILNLNVFTPRPRAANGPAELLPVLVFDLLEDPDVTRAWSRATAGAG
jgi:hypothetical protein